MVRRKPASRGESSVLSGSESPVLVRDYPAESALSQMVRSEHGHQHSRKDSAEFFRSSVENTAAVRSDSPRLPWFALFCAARPLRRFCSKLSEDWGS
jgi:hypothetical protein